MRNAKRKRETKRVKTRRKVKKYNCWIHEIIRKLQHRFRSLSSMMTTALPSALAEGKQTFLVVIVYSKTRKNLSLMENMCDRILVRTAFRLYLKAGHSTKAFTATRSISSGEFCLVLRGRMPVRTGIQFSHPIVCDMFGVVFCRIIGISRRLIVFLIGPRGCWCRQQRKLFQIWEVLSFFVPKNQLIT